MAYEPHDIPGVGPVRALIDVQTFYQAGQELRSLEAAYSADGSPITGTSLEEVRRVLIERGVIRY